jgi:hypothetical protein
MERIRIIKKAVFSKTGADEKKVGAVAWSLPE